MRFYFFIAALAYSLMIDGRDQRTLLIDVSGTIGFISPDCLGDWNDNNRTLFIASLIALAHNTPVLNHQTVQHIVDQAVITSCITLNEALCYLTSYSTDIGSSPSDELLNSDKMLCAVKHIIRKHSVVCYLDANDFSIAQTQKNLSSDNLRDIIKYLHDQELVDTELFDPQEQYEINEIGDFYVTDQTFAVSPVSNSQKTGLIIREMNRGIEQVARLYCGQKTTALIPAQYPQALENTVTLIFPVCYFALKIDTNDRIYAIIPQASGRQLSEYMKEYKLQPTKDMLNQASAAYYQSGRGLSIVHHTYTTTEKDDLFKCLVHGDFHHFHVFYDELLNRVSFIDNEYMAYFFINRQHPTQDITNFFDETLGPNLTPSSFYNGFNTEQWIDTTLSSFLEGYLSYVRPEERYSLINHIWKAFKEKNDRWLQYEKHKTVFDRVCNRLMTVQGASV